MNNHFKPESTILVFYKMFPKGGYPFTMKFLKLEQSTIYPVDPWQVTESNFEPKRNLLSETIFSLANGYIGFRGSFEEGLNESETKSIDGTYLNGFYESVPIPHTERGFGSALNTQTRLNVTDSKLIEVELEGERFCLDAGTILAYKRTLDMKAGFQTREVTWRSPRGKEVRITVKRVVPFTHRHLLAIEYQVVPLNFSGKITITSSLNGGVDNHTHVENDPRFSASLGELCMVVSAIESHGTGAMIEQKTNRSKLTLTCAMENHLVEGTLIAAESGQAEKSVYNRFIVNARANEPVTLVKYAAYYTSRDYPINELAELARSTTSNAKSAGFQTLLSEQEQYCTDYWDTVGISIEGDPKVEQGLRFNLFHLLQATGNRGQTSIAAKGLTSEGYDGHYFWDTETYLLPFYASIKPSEARNLLAFRYSILDHARNRARELSHEKGALYPWRTIAGEEGSSYFPASTAQYHINAAIAYAINKYIETTGDYSLMIDFGAEILFETARLWADLGTYVPRKGNRFCFNEVTGPDEYSALVNNNCYTNLMAQWHLRYAYETAQILKQNHPSEYHSIAKKIDLQDEELQAWILAAEYMYVPYDETMQIHPQDDGFLDKEIWDFSTMPQDKYPLLLYYHPLVIYRYQVCKQPDVILAHLLLGDRFSLQQKRRDYDYYEPITTHDSTLSPSIFSIASSELGYRDDAYRFFTISARLDLDNIMNATHFGIHIANMAGTWLSLVNGFAGMRTKAGKLSFEPYLPEQLNSYSFRITFQDRSIEIAVKENSASYKLLAGEKISFTHHGEMVDLEEGVIAIHSLSDHESR
jgi:trehalose/maltose hydrolase-like predicted phosphorylase